MTKQRILVTAMAALAGCSGNATKMMRIVDGGGGQPCTVDAACASGHCLPSPTSANSWCAASDGSCASILRWTATAGDGLAGGCVDSVDFGVPRDLAVGDQSPSSDMTQLGCSMLINCINGCQDNGCRQACFDAASPSAQNEYSNLLMCLMAACPSAMKSDPCFMQGPVCTQCYTAAQTNGKCVAESQTCSNN